MSSISAGWMVVPMVYEGGGAVSPSGNSIYVCSAIAHYQGWHCLAYSPESFCPAYIPFFFFSPYLRGICKREPKTDKIRACVWERLTEFGPRWRGGG